MIDHSTVKDEFRRVENAIRRSLGTNPPSWDESVKKKADQLVEGTMECMGHEIDIGRKDIDWSGGHLDHHVWKSRPNRFLYITPLAAAYAETGEEQYAETARDYIEDWIRAHPSRPDWELTEEDNPLNLPIRVGDNVRAARGWLGALPYFLKSPSFDDEFVAQMVESIRCQLGWLTDNLSPAGNFRMFQAMTLINAGLRLRFVGEAAEWRRQGAHVMTDMARRQINLDGSHCEHSPGYHLGMMGAFNRCVDLQRAFPELPLSVDPDRVAGMYDYALAFTRPDNTFCAINDSPSGSTVDVGKRLEQRRNFRTDNDLPETDPSPTQVFPSAGQAYFRTGWEKEATYLVFDATNWGSAHCHLARNSLRLHSHGRPLIVDPGRINYEMSDPLGPYGKSTRAHSTINLNGWNQNTTNNDEFRVWTGPGYGAATSLYTAGYWDAPFGWWFFEGLGQGLAARHRRSLLFLNDRAVVVIDRVMRWDEEGRGDDHENPSLEVNWQLAPDPLSIETDDDRARIQYDDAGLLMRFPRCPEGSEITVYEGEEGPPRGWIKHREKGMAGEPAPQLSLESSPMHNYEEYVVSVLVPFSSGAEPDVTATMVSMPNTSSPGCVRLEWGDGTVDSVHWMQDMETMIGTVDEMETDGSMLHLQRGENGNLQRAGVADGTYCDAAPDDAQIVVMDQQSPVSR